MTSFLTHEGGIAAGLTVNFAQKRQRQLPGPSEQLWRRVHSYAAKLFLARRVS
jgi:hypothetical protein